VSNRIERFLGLIAVAALTFAVLTFATSEAFAVERAVAFATHDEHIDISIGGQRVARYVLRDKQVLRPYFTAVATITGRQVTRNHPPKEGQDPTDHAAMHPGIWLAFGDLGGEDFWRNKGRVVHGKCVEQPKAAGQRGSFVVENEYLAAQGERSLCRERCRWSVVVAERGWWLLYDGEFAAAVDNLAFGDQEEMGLGVRLATGLTVAKGGAILDSAGRQNEKSVWGQQADWCDYAGTIDGRQVGVALVPHGENFRPSWFHVRDYGLMVANPFGRNAFTRGEKSRIEIRRDKPLRLRFALFVHESAGESVDRKGVDGKSVGVAAAVKELDDGKWIAARKD
jgi:hypothetical protein